MSKSKVTKQGDREIRVERVFDAPRERVWSAMTESKLIAQWWGRGHKLVVESNDVKPGGKWRFVEHAPEGVFGFEGRFREVKAPERLVLTFGWDGMPGHGHGRELRRSRPVAGGVEWRCARAGRRLREGRRRAEWARAGASCGRESTAARARRPADDLRAREDRR